MVQKWFPTECTGKNLNCSLKGSTRTHGLILSFKVRRTHTHFEYRMVRIWFPTQGARKIESWGPGITRLGRRRSGRRVSRVPEIPRRTSARWSSSPGVIPGRVSSSIPGGLRHNSREFPVVYHWIQIPQKAAEEVLEAWSYTRRWNSGGP